MKAPMFSYLEETMDADDWLRIIETNLDLTNYNDEHISW